MTQQSQNFQALRSNISVKLKPNSQMLKPVHQGPGWVRIMKTMEVANLVTHFLYFYAVQDNQSIFHCSACVI